MQTKFNHRVPAVGKLAEQIAGEVSVIQQRFLGSANAAGGTVASFTGQLDDAVVSQARLAVVECCKQLVNLLSRPTEVLKQMALVDKHNLVSLQIINHFDIASLVPEAGMTSQQKISDISKVPLGVLSRVLRQAMTNGIFYEPKAGFVAHTETSRAIPQLSPLLKYQLEICLPSSVKLLQSLKQDEEAGSAGKRIPFQIAHNTDESWWVYAENSPAWMETYGQYMALITSGGAHDVSFVVEGVNWAKFGRGPIIDVGGGDGFVGITIASAAPELKVVVQDFVNLQQAADAKISQSLKKRVSFTPHSFFEAQPSQSKTADAFLLRHILHDWAGADCVWILGHIVAAMRHDAKIIVAEQLLPGIGEVPMHTEKVMRALDMQMMVQFGGKERTLDDWKILFQMAEPRLKIDKITTPSGSADSFIELSLS